MVVVKSTDDERGASNGGCGLLAGTGGSCGWTGDGREARVVGMQGCCLNSQCCRA